MKKIISVTAVVVLLGFCLHGSLKVRNIARKHVHGVFRKKVSKSIRIPLATQLHKAIIDDDLPLAQFFLRQKKGFDVNQPPPHFARPFIMIAAELGRERIVEELVRAGAQINIHSRYTGFTPLREAVYHGHSATAKILVEAGAFLDLQCFTWGATNLIVATYFGYSNMVKMLILAGARVDLSDVVGKTMFDYAKDSPPLLQTTHESLIEREIRALMAIELD